MCGMQCQQNCSEVFSAKKYEIFFRIWGRLNLIEKKNYNKKTIPCWNWVELRTTYVMRTVGSSNLCLEMNVRQAVKVSLPNATGKFKCLLSKDEPRMSKSNVSLNYKFFFSAHCPVHSDEHYPKYTKVICINPCSFYLILFTVVSSVL